MGSSSGIIGTPAEADEYRNRPTIDPEYHDSGTQNDSLVRDSAARVITLKIGMRP